MAQDDTVPIQLAQLAEQMKAIPRIEQALQMLVQLDKQLAEVVVRSDGHSKHLNAMWAKVDELRDWQMAHDKAASERIDKITEYIDTQVSVLEALIKVSQETADNAHIKVDAIINQHKGSSRTLALGATLFGTLVTAMIIWVVSETYDTAKKVAVFEERFRARQEDSR